MINYGEMAREVANAIKENSELFDRFVSNYSEITLLNDEDRMDILVSIDEAQTPLGDYFYKIFNADYTADEICNLNAEEYYIDNFDRNYYSLYLKYNEDVVGRWMPIIFIKEFWDFYFDYINKKKEDEKMVCSSESKEELKQNETNIDDICRIIAEDFVKNYNNYISMFTTFDNFSDLSENDYAEFLANFFKRLF